MRYTSIGAGLAAGLALMLAASKPLAAPTARQLALAHRYVEAIHMDRTVNASLAAVAPAMRAALPHNANLTEAQRQAIQDVTLEVTADMVRRMTAQMEPLMAETFTEKELADLVAFYESPTGQALIAKQPVLAARMAPMLTELIPQMQAETKAKLCARIDCAALPGGAPKP